MQLALFSLTGQQTPLILDGVILKTLCRASPTLIPGPWVDISAGGHHLALGNLCLDEKTLAGMLGLASLALCMYADD